MNPETTHSDIPNQPAKSPTHRPAGGAPRQVVGFHLFAASQSPTATSTGHAKPTTSKMAMPNETAFTTGTSTCQKNR